MERVEAPLWNSDEMNADETVPADLPVVEPLPQQFGLSQLLWLLAGAALLCAIFAPVARQVSPESLWWVALRLLLQLFANIVSAWFALRDERRAWEYGGRLLGYGYLRGSWLAKLIRLGTFTWIVVVAAIQLGVVYYTLTIPPSFFGWSGLIDPILAGWWGGGTLVWLRNVRTIGATRFFENGFATATGYTPFCKLVRVRESERYEGAIDVVVFPYPKYNSPILCTTHVSEQLKQYLLEHHGIDTKADV